MEASSRLAPASRFCLIINSLFGESHTLLSRLRTSSAFPFFFGLHDNFLSRGNHHFRVYNLLEVNCGLSQVWVPNSTVELRSLQDSTLCVNVLSWLFVCISVEWSSTICLPSLSGDLFSRVKIDFLDVESFHFSLFPRFRALSQFPYSNLEFPEISSRQSRKEWPMMPH